MKTEQQYLNEAKEEVAKKCTYPEWITLVALYDKQSKDIYSPLNEAAILALQKQRDDLNIELSNYAYQMDLAKRERDQAESKMHNWKKELKDKIDLEAKRRYAGERFNNGRINAINHVLEILNTL